MAAKDLISLSRAYQALPISSGVDSLLETLITACSDAIQKYCRRSFYARTLEELHDGGQETLVLRDYPVQSIAWVRCNPTTVLTIRNTASSNQRATVAVTSTGLTLVRVASGTTTTDTSVTFSGNATLSAVATAINALGNGWSATAASEYGLFASADLYIPPDLGDGTQSQGAYSAARGAAAELKLHVDELGDYQWYRTGILRRGGGALDDLWDHQGWARFPGGAGYYRVKYTAGYTVVPEAVQEACATWVAYCYHRTERDPGLVGSFPSGGDASNWFPPASPPREVEGLLLPFRKRSL